MVSLFLEPVKIAVSNAGIGLKNTVEGPPELWSEQVLSALYADHPYMLDYSPGMEVNRMDPDAGYMLGVITFGSDEEPGKILAVVQDKHILPFATFVFQGVAYPLTEERVGEVFSAMPEETAISPENISMHEMLGDQDMTPPEHASSMGGMGNRMIANKLGSAILDKISSASADVLADYMRALEPEWAAPVKEHWNSRMNADFTADKLPEKVASNAYAAYQDTFLIRPGTSTHMEILATSSTFRKIAAKHLTRQEMQNAFAPQKLAEVKEAIAAKGYYVSSNALVKLSEDIGMGSIEFVDRPGMWMVKKSTGESLVGVVLPNVVDFSNLLLPMKLFYNGSSATVQDEIVGEYISEYRVPETDENPKGESTFVFQDRSGSIRCTIPFVVSNEMPTEMGQTIFAETYLGDHVQFIKDQMNISIAEVDDGVFAVPAHYRLVNIGDPQNRSGLVSTPEEYVSFQKMGSHLALRIFGGGDYDIKGSGYNLRNLTHDEACFHLAAMGAPNPPRLLKRADSLGVAVNLYGEIPTDQSPEIEAQLDKLVKHADKVMEDWRPNPANLVKIAAWMLKHPKTIDPTDLEKLAELAPETVDTVLSLGFVTPTNTRNFVESIGDIEDATRKMASLVIASQLGYSEIPLDEATTALYSMEKVLMGLRRLQAQVD